MCYELLICTILAVVMHSVESVIYLRQFFPVNKNIVDVG